MRRITGFGILIVFFLTMISIVLAQGQFTLEQTSASNGGASSGGVYSVRDVVGEPGIGISSGGAYQVIGGLALDGSGPASTFSLNVTVNGQGTVTLDPPGRAYSAGTVVQLTATPGAGFSFASWGGGVTGAVNPITITMDGDKTVTVTFTQVSSGDTHIHLPLIRR